MLQVVKYLSFDSRTSDEFSGPPRRADAETTFFTISETGQLRAVRGFEGVWAAPFRGGGGEEYGQGALSPNPPPPGPRGMGSASSTDGRATGRGRGKAQLHPPNALHMPVSCCRRATMSTTATPTTANRRSWASARRCPRI